MDEIWRDIPGLEYYQASNKGRIRSLSRTVPCGPPPGTRLIPERVIKQFLVNTTGYGQIKVGGKKYSSHRLIASTWCDGYFDGACVDHLNNIRIDNRPENLEWVTYGENTRRSFERGRVSYSLGKFSSDHPTSKPVVSTRLDNGIEVTWPSAMDAVRAGYDSSCISRCCSGQSKTHKGCTWEYGDRHGVQWSEPNPYEVTA